MTLYREFTEPEFLSASQGPGYKEKDAYFTTRSNRDGSLSMSVAAHPPHILAPTCSHHSLHHR